MWTFWCFLLSDSACPIRDWYEDLNAGDQSGLDRVLEYLEDHDVTEWQESPYVTQLRGYTGIYEIRVRRLRPLGYFDPRQGDFTVLLGASEIGNRFVPKRAPQTAEKRKALVRAGEARIHERCY